jgi:hypothetical protein
MAAGLGTIAQLAYLVRPGGLTQALDHWVRVMGAGPFFTGNFPLTDQLYLGAPTNQDAIVACGYLGEVQIELIDTLTDAPGVYTAFLRANPVIPAAGLYHHVMVEAGDCDATLARLEAGGCKAVFSARVPDGGRLFYLDASATIGGYVEVLDSATWPAVAEAMKAARHDWDGRDPVRPFARLDPGAAP